MPELETTLREIEDIVHRRDRSRIQDLIAFHRWNKDSRIEKAASWALGRICDVSDLPELEGLLRRSGHLNDGVEIAQAILRLGSDDVRERTVAYLMKGAFSIDSQLGGSGLRHPHIVPFVEPYCKSPNWRIKGIAQRFVDRHALPESTPSPTAPATQEEIAGWMATVVGTLGETGNPASAATILDPQITMDVRSNVVAALKGLLINCAAKAPLASLHHLLSLPNEILGCWEYVDYEFGVSTGVWAIDLTEMKRSATAELKRRGL